ncbi:hypothetical protein R4282_00655 [Rhodococcus oxybenzonivorans]|uniref:hypothetical protein n=1 Tax=Rhodococcus oxybenzonivorans TaxID=1990687 RepID=UPI002953E931|nr:hypothetical protein [Rhodococcus oxybenzonivorans]MDV7351523.1 hypothetical protein [Rhodococcus oxybenzonivorans]
MTRVQVAAAVLVGYWLGRGHRKKLGILLAAAGAGRLAGGPQEMVDRAAKLLRSSPEFAELSESVRGQLLDAVKVAAMTATTARIDALNNRLLSGDDAVLETAEELVEDTADMAGDVTGDAVDMAGDVTGDAVGTVGNVTGDAVGTVGNVTGDTVGTVRNVTGDALGALGALGRRKRPKAAPSPDDRDDGDEGDEPVEQAEDRPVRRRPRRRGAE